MDDSLEVFFCDLCNTSVPLRDLEIGVASRFKGRVIGGCCLADLRAAGRGRGGSANLRGAAAGMTILMLIAIAGATIFLDRRLSDEIDQLRERIAALDGAAERRDGRLTALEERLVAVPARADLDALGKQLSSLHTGFENGYKAVDGRLGGFVEQVKAVGRDIGAVQHGQRQLGSSLERFERELRLLGAEVAALGARPRETPPSGSQPPAPPAEAAAPPAAVGGLPPELAHEVARLGDADAGIRFEAVDKLIASRSNAVLEHVVAMVKDADPFVRRLTVDGLQHFRQKSAVEALLDALMDPEDLVRHYANASLQILTGQKIAYDPDAGRDQRSQGQRRWREWWEKNRAGF
jgi:hypothetical protein